MQDDGLPRSRAPRVQRSGLGDRLAAKGYSFDNMVSLLCCASCFFGMLGLLHAQLCLHASGRVLRNTWSRLFADL